MRVHCRRETPGVPPHVEAQSTRHCSNFSFPIGGRSLSSAHMHLLPITSSSSPHSDDLLVLCPQPRCSECGPWTSTQRSAQSGPCPRPVGQNGHCGKTQLMRAGQSQEALQRTSSNSESRTPAPGSVAGTALSAFRKALWITGCCPTTPCQGPHSPCREEVTQPQSQSEVAQCSPFIDEETECVPWLWTRERECLTAFPVSGSLPSLALS